MCNTCNELFENIGCMNFMRKSDALIIKYLFLAMCVLHTSVFNKEKLKRKHITLFSDPSCPNKIQFLKSVTQTQIEEFQNKKTSTLSHFPSTVSFRHPL